jgi:hypothetical protein
VISYRFADYGTPLRTIPANQAARYHLGNESDSTQYLCLHPLGPLAELMRSNSLRTPDQIRAVHTRTWALEVDVADLPSIGFDNAADFGMEAADLVADERTGCQELATRVRNELPGIIVPSAALPGTRNAILFGSRVAAPYLTDPVSFIDVPASITAQDGRPLLSLIDVVRFIGEPHAALQAWERRDAFTFREPSWSLEAERQK